MNGNGISVFDTVQNIDSKTIRALFLDSNNIMWIGTNKGIVSYDGYSFRKIEGIEEEEVQVLCFTKTQDPTYGLERHSMVAFISKIKNYTRLNSLQRKGFLLSMKISMEGFGWVVLEEGFI